MLKHRLSWLLLAFGILLFAVPAHAQTYSFQLTSVTSNSTPVNILPAAQRTTWGCNTLVGATVIDFWSYSGSLPVSKPTNYYIINPASPVGDGVLQNGPPVQPLAAVLDTGAAATNVYCWWR